MSEGYAIIRDAKKGHSIGIDVLAMVDRSKNKRTWWTSDSTFDIMKFRKRSAAEFSARRLCYGNVRVVDFESACRMISQQDDEISYHMASCEAEMGWDSHKNY